MPSLRSTLRFFLEPLLGVGMFCLWLAAVGSSSVTSVSMQRESNSTINIYAVLIAAGFAVAITVTRIRPTWSLVIAGAMLLLQLLYWPARFGTTSWTAYLMLPMVAFGVAFYARHVSKAVGLTVGVTIVVVFAGAVSALLNFPNLSISGGWGTINGTPWGSDQIAPGFASWAVVGLLVGLGTWRLGVTSRRRLSGGDPRASSQTLERVPEEENLSIATLSPRENEIYRFLVSGMSNREIAQAANIEESTVKSHVSNLLTKLNVKSRAQLIARDRITPSADMPVRVEST